MTRRFRRGVALLGACGLAATSLVALPLSGTPSLLPTAEAAPGDITLVGDLQNEISSCAEWTPDCTETLLTDADGDGTAEYTATVPAGSYSFKIALNGTWDEAYPAENVPLNLAVDSELTFTFDTATNKVGIQPGSLAGEYDAATDLVAEPVRNGTGENFYFVLTDRFENGNTANDQGGLEGDRLVHGFDPADKAFYNGGDIAGLQQRLPYLDDLGITAIWLTPSFKNKPVQGEGNLASSGYHGYWITDFTQIDPHLGTNEELKAFIDQAHARDIKVYFDIITNHTADQIQYQTKDGAPVTANSVPYISTAEVPYYDAAGNPINISELAGSSEFPALDPAVSFPYVPVRSGDIVPAVLNDTTLYHNRGDAVWSDVNSESYMFGDFDTLDGIMTEHPTVVNAMEDIYKTWVDFGIDGFRIDTVKHVNMEFWQEWTTAISDHATATGNLDFFMFGEVFDADATKLSPYVRKTDMDSVLDFAYQSSMANYTRGFTAQGLSGVFAADDYYTTPSSSAADLPTFLGNHDMGRIGNLIQGSGNEEARSILAHETMFLTRGQPVVYYGDEQGFVGHDKTNGGADKDARQSLFATQVADYQNQNLLDGTPAGTGPHFGTDGELYQTIAAVGDVRTAHPALNQGAQIELFAADGPGIYAFARVDRTEKTEYVVAVNNTMSDQTATFATLTPGASYSPIYGTDTAVSADADGITVTVPALTAIVLKANAPVAGFEDPAVTVDMAGHQVDGLTPISATVPADRWSETTFSYRTLGTTEWTPLGTATDDTPRVFHDASGLPNGTIIEYRAVTVDATGATVADSGFGIVGADLSGAPSGPGMDDMVTVPGSHNAAMGCAGDWAPDCGAAALTQDDSGWYVGTFDLPAGDYEYKVAIGGSWEVSYGAGGVPDGANVRYAHAGGSVTFYYNPDTHYYFNTSQHPVMTLPGSYQSAVGCPGDWQPECLVTMLTDLDGDGTFTYVTSDIPQGSYEVKVAHGLSWDENYGVDGTPGGGNYSFYVEAGQTVTFSYDPQTHILTIDSDVQAAIGMGQLLGQWIDAGTIALAPSHADTGDVYTLHYAADGELGLSDGAVTGADGSIELTRGVLTTAQIEQYPHLSNYVALSLGDQDPALLKQILKGSTMLTVSSDGVATVATGLQIPGVLDDLYAEAARANGVGVEFDATGAPTLSLWAPTASNVSVNLFSDVKGTGDPEVIAMTEDTATGIWTVTGDPSWENRAYTYNVDVWVPRGVGFVTNTVTDPYSTGLTLNSTHSVLVDLDDPAWAPSVWEGTPAPVVENFSDHAIYEMHIRDFSITDETVPEEMRGTYKAFALEDSAGMNHLRELSAAGMNTIHLLPSFDIATIEENRADQAVPVIPDAAPNSEEQQAALEPVKDSDAFNWGYDPYHYSVPEGSYATEGNQVGGDRTYEFREMVGGLHAADYQVILDQVFNHTAQSGQAEKSVLDQVVPGYYHRLNATGSVENSTCCENVATEHAMAEQLMVDSVVSWARDYKVDGFRFDLMGHHSRDNMLAVRAALDELTLEEDGVDGSSMYLYGEGWNFGEVTSNARFYQATQGQLDGTGIGAFNDRLRDAVHGGGPFDDDKRQFQGFGNGLFTDPNNVFDIAPEDARADLLHRTDLIRVGLAGNLRDYTFTNSNGQQVTGAQVDYNGSPAGYATQPYESVNYVDAHDNETLYDLNMWKLPFESTMDTRIRMNTLSLSTVMLGQSPAFWHAGTDLLRSKSMDRDSYNSGDHFNAIDWSGQESNFGVGLPPAEKNQDKWPLMRDFMDPNNGNWADRQPNADAMAESKAQAIDLLKLRDSSRLFRLNDAALIQDMVTFPNAVRGDKTPGVIFMHIDDTTHDVDPAFEQILVVFNSDVVEVTEAVDGLDSSDAFILSPIQANGSDDVVKGATYADGTVTVPARTTAVFVVEQEQVEEPVAVTPEAPVANDVEGTGSDTVTIPVVEGVEYLVDGVVVSGEYAVPEGVESVVVTAQAVEGYVLAEGATSEWTFTFDTTVPVPPAPPVPPFTRGFLLDANGDGLADVASMFGRSGDEPLVGDWDGDGRDTIGVRRGAEFFLKNSLGQGPADLTFIYGRASDDVLVGDWDGNGTDTIAVVRGNKVFARNSLTAGPANLEFYYGRVGDTYLAGDWNGDGRDTVGVRRGNAQFLSNDNRVAAYTYTFGRTTDVPVVGDFDGDGADAVSIRRGIMFYLNHSNTAPVASDYAVMGMGTDVPAVGDFNGDGVTEIGIYR